MLRLLSLASWSVYVVAPLGLCLSLSLLATLGGSARRFFLGEGAFGRAKPWAFDIALGMLLAGIYFVVRSFLKKAMPWMPAVAEQEPALIGLLGLGLLRRPLLRAVLRESVEPLSLAAGLAFFASIFVWGYWHFFNLMPASTDPGVIAALVEITRRQGMVPLVVGPANPTLPSYPMGIEVLSWTLLNPLLASMSVVQVWPSLTTSLLAFVLFEGFSSEARLGRRPFLAFLVATLLVRVLIGAFEVSQIWSYLEGASKRSLGFMMGFAAVAAWKAPRYSSAGPVRSGRGGTWAALILVALAFPVLVNPINFYVSAAGTLAYGVFLAWTQARAAFWRSAGLGVVGSLAVVALASLQDPTWVRRLGPRGLPCRIFARSTPFCSWTELQRQQASQVNDIATVDPSAPQAPWESFLSAPAREWRFLLYPARVRPFATDVAAPAASLLLGLPLGAFGLFSLARRIRAAASGARAGFAPRAVAIPAWVLAWGFGAVPLLSRLQTWLVYRSGDLHVRGLLADYGDQAYVNLWQPAYFAVVLGSMGLLLRCIGAMARRRSALICCGLLGCAVLLGGLVNARAITRLRSRIHPDYGRSSSELASLYIELGRRLRPGDVVMLSSQRYDMSGEQWVFPDGESFGLQLYTSNPTLYSFSGFWRPSATSAAAHFKRLCRFDCDYLRQEKVDVLVDIKDRTFLCGMPVSDYIRESGCFAPEATVETPKRSRSATIYRLKGV